MMDHTYVYILDSGGKPLGSGRVVQWCQTTIRTKAGGCGPEGSWENEYGQVPAVIVETDAGFRVIPLADQWGQAEIRKVEAPHRDAGVVTKQTPEAEVK
jgi:hypothetical protein